MSPENQRIAIAKACGWKTFEDSENYPSPKVWTDPGGRARCWSDIPDYLNDLNAMHEAEKTLTPDQQDGYQNGLGNLVAGQPFETYNHWSNVGCAFVCHATAPQRAEAFLKTLGLWTED